MTGQLVEITAYNPSWPDLAARTIDELHQALPGMLSVIEHIGSTAVPGLVAKPIIDLMAAADDLAALAAAEDSLTAIGFLRHVNAMTDRLLYVRAVEGTRTHILHVVALSTWPTRNQRLLRDYLLAHPNEAARYAELKRTLVTAGTTTADYARAKTPLIQELTDRARAQRGLPSTPVWEK